MIHIFSHNDLDGQSCGMLGRIAFGEESVKATYCSHDTINQRVSHFLDEVKDENQTLYITDIAVNDDVAKKIQSFFESGHTVHLIDHHATAFHLNSYKWAKVIDKADDGKLTSATSLFYEHLVEKGLLQDSGALKEYVELVRQYDTWEWFENENNNAKRLNDLFYLFPPGEFEQKIQARLQTEPKFTFNDVEITILTMEEDRRNGYIRRKQRQMVEIWHDYSTKESKGRYRIGIVHAENHQSELGNELNRNNPHLDLIVLINIGTKRIGFRTIHDEVNVSLFAKQYGGGGHPKASGGTLTKEGFDHFVTPAFEVWPRKQDAQDNTQNTKGNSHGTFYINHDKEITSIHTQKENSWKILHKKDWVNEIFPSFEEAEMYVKRHYNSWLMDDIDFKRHQSES
ncbi:DHH family phosphoesterase [Peribacillus acanthi]|uniref:DHH family phosphoesterase n=1 Tax=Peribacillus acanthi TaxID=2171554 RepID=UPI000D3EBC06|nr:DHHA1 domain-containing protein [Peribacillus acanthi]